MNDKELNLAVLVELNNIAKYNIAACIVKRPGIAPAYTRWQNRSIRLPRIRDGTKVCLLNH